MFSLSPVERQAVAGIALILVVFAVFHETMQLKEVGMHIQTQLMEDHYSILKVDEGAAAGEIRTAYRRLTGVFNARPQDDTERIKRAKVTQAYSVLTDVTARQQYDQRRRFTKHVIHGIIGLMAVIPALGLFYLLSRLMKSLATAPVYGLDPKSPFARVVKSFSRIEQSLEVIINKGDAQRLGLQMDPTSTTASGPALLVKGIAGGGAVERHNSQVREMACAEHAATGKPADSLTWWSSAEIREGDIVIEVNGTRVPAEMMQQLANSEELKLRITRPLKGLLPWVTEVPVRRQSAQERWGCQMSPAKDGSNTLEVASVDAGCALAGWNESHPALRVRNGDRVVAVNGSMGPDKILSTLRDPNTIDTVWVIVRGVLPRPLVPEVTCGPLHKRAGDRLGIRMAPALESPVRGSVVEAKGQTANLVVVKEVVSGMLVDQWNQRQGPTVHKVGVGTVVTAVNGKSDPAEFTVELGKPVVTLRVRPPQGTVSLVPEGQEATPDNSNSIQKQDVQSANSRQPSTGSTGSPSHSPLQSTPPAACSKEVSVARSAPPSASQGAATPSAPSTAAHRTQARGARVVQVQFDEEHHWLYKFLLGLLPAFLRPKNFEARLRQALTSMRCEFQVNLDRTQGPEGRASKIGLQLSPARDGLGGLMVDEVTAASLIGYHNQNSQEAGLTTVVRSGDRLIGVNGACVAAMMMEVLQSREVDALEMRFSRRAADCAPGLWEAEIERASGEGWGMTIQEQMNSCGTRGAGPLRIDDLADGPIDRWNKSTGSASRWSVEPGDLIVACEPAVGAKNILTKLKENNRVKLTLLRWHAGPAPEAAADDHDSWSFTVTLQRVSSGDKLGLRLDPSKRDPTRTCVSKVLEGGLADLHNKKVRSSLGPTATHNVKLHDIREGDEVDAVNGDRNPSSFPELSKASCVVMTLRRRAPQVQENKEASRGISTPLPATPPVKAASSPPIASQEALSSPAKAPSQRIPPPAKAPSMPSTSAASSKSIVPPVSTVRAVDDTAVGDGWDFGLDEQEATPAPASHSNLPKADVEKPRDLVKNPVVDVEKPRDLVKKPTVVGGGPSAKSKDVTEQAPQTSTSSEIAQAERCRAADPQPEACIAQAPQPTSDPKPNIREREPCDMNSASTPSTSLSSGAPSPSNNAGSAQAAREVFLMKAEIETLKRRLASSGKDEELIALRTERDKLRLESNSLRMQTNALQTELAQLKESARAGRRAMDEAAALRAENAELRTQERRLQEALQRSTELADASARRAAESERPAPAVHSSNGGSVPTASLERLERGVSLLRELSMSLEHTLVTEDD